jgi:hypothetical protein
MLVSGTSFQKMAAFEKGPVGSVVESRYWRASRGPHDRGHPDPPGTCHARQPTGAQEKRRRAAFRRPEAIEARGLVRVAARKCRLTGTVHAQANDESDTVSYLRLRGTWLCRALPRRPLGLLGGSDLRSSMTRLEPLGDNCRRPTWSGSPGTAISSTGAQTASIPGGGVPGLLTLKGHSTPASRANGGARSTCQ